MLSCNDHHWWFNNHHWWFKSLKPASSVHPLSPTTIAGIASSILLFVAVIATMVCCFMCSCCYLYQRRQQRGRTPFDGETRSCTDHHPNASVLTAKHLFAPQPSRSPWPVTQCSLCMMPMENPWGTPSISTLAIRWLPSILACPPSTLSCSLVLIHHRWWILHTVRVICYWLAVIIKTQTALITISWTSYKVNALFVSLLFSSPSTLLSPTISWPLMSSSTCTHKRTHSYTLKPHEEQRLWRRGGLEGFLCVRNIIQLLRHLNSSHWVLQRPTAPPNL